MVEVEEFRVVVEQWVYPTRYIQGENFFDDLVGRICGDGVRVRVCDPEGGGVLVKRVVFTDGGYSADLEAFAREILGMVEIDGMSRFEVPLVDIRYRVNGEWVK